MVFDRYGVFIPHISFLAFYIHTAAIKCHLKIASNETIRGAGVASNIRYTVLICGWADGNSLSFFEAAILHGA